MEASENNDPKKESTPKKQTTEKENTQELQKTPNKNIYSQYQKEKENIQEQVDNSQIQNNSVPIPNPHTLSPSDNEHNSQEGGEAPQEKAKRRRRGKSEINDRKFLCPDCDKCYLSGPALTTHRKNKHGYGVMGEKEKKRGRPPKKEEGNEGNQNALNKFNSFFNDERRKKNNIQENKEEKKESSKNEENKDSENIKKEVNEEKEIELNKIKGILTKIFQQCKKEIFQDIENIDNYSFYNLIIKYWENSNENAFPPEEKFCFTAPEKKGEIPSKLDSFNIDQLFFNYLKEFSNKVNDDYLWFMFKFIVLFRECINLKKKHLIRSENQSENRKLYTQIYNAETVPEICNYFFLEFLQPYDYFGLLKEELIELVQHFCYWLYKNQYTQSHLTLLED